MHDIMKTNCQPYWIQFLQKAIILVAVLLFNQVMALAQINSTPCNTASPWVDGSYTGLSAEIVDNVSSDIPLCTGDVTSIGSLADADTENFTEITITGVGCNATIGVTDTDGDIYPAGTWGGYRIGTADLLGAGVAAEVTLTTWNNGVLQETYEAISSLVSVNSDLVSADGTTLIGFVTSLPFDEIQISYESLVSTLFTAQVYHPVITKYCAGPTPDCNMPTALIQPDFPAAVSFSEVTGVSLGTITNAENLVNPSTDDFATIALPVGVDATGTIGVKDQLSNYDAGTFAGFEIGNSTLLGLGLMENSGLSTYLNGVLQETRSGNDLLLSVPLLVADARNTVGFISSLPFDEIRYTINQFVGLDVGTTSVYHAVIKRYCEGPALACSTPVYMTEPTYPVSIDGLHTGITGGVCAGCSVTNASNVIDQDQSNYAGIILTAGVDISGSLSVKNQLTNYPAGTFAGFDLANPNLLGVDLLDNLTVSTYLDGNPVESMGGRSDLLSVSTSLLTGDGFQRIGFVATQSFDEVSITVEQTVSADVGTTNVYNAVLERFCERVLTCYDTYWLTQSDFPVIINSKNTGTSGVACVGCAVQNPEYAIDNDNTTYALIQVPVEAGGSASLSVLDALSTYSSGSFAGFAIQDENDILQVELFNNITITTYLDGVEQESQTSTNLADLSVLVEVIGSGAGIYNVGFNTTLPFDEVEISVGSLASVINLIRVYGAFIDNRGATGASLDSEPPVITCPVAVEAVVDTGECEATIADLGTPVTSDNCRIDTVYNNAPVRFPVGNTTVTWTVADTGGNTATCEQTVTVTSPPIALNDTVTTLADTPVSVSVLLNDTDCDDNIDPATLTQLVAPVHGTISIDAGNMTYTPTAGFIGADSTTY